MQVTHILSQEVLYILTDAAGTLFVPPKIIPSTQYCCRRWTAAQGYSLVTLYGVELQPVVPPTS